jgi:hypothetical protein
MELTDGQFERLVGLLAETRVAIRSSHNELMSELEKTKRELREEIRHVASGQSLLGSHLTAIEEDLGKVQIAQRGHTEEIGQVHQALEGITQLTKSTWDQTESIQKHIHGEASIEHVTGHESQRPQ